MKFLLDTNVISELRRGAKGNPGVVAWGRREDEADYALSVITIKEIEFGILLLARRDVSQSLLHRAWLDHQVLPRFQRQIIDVDLRIALQAAALEVPNPRPTADSLIAATALVHDLTVVTRNVAHFRPMGVRLINPFSP